MQSEVHDDDSSVSERPPAAAGQCGVQKVEPACEMLSLFIDRGRRTLVLAKTTFSAEEQTSQHRSVQRLRSAMHPVADAKLCRWHETYLSEDANLTTSPVNPNLVEG